MLHASYCIDFKKIIYNYSPTCQNMILVIYYVSGKNNLTVTFNNIFLGRKLQKGCTTKCELLLFSGSFHAIQLSISITPLNIHHWWQIAPTSRPEHAYH